MAQISASPCFIVSNDTEIEQLEPGIKRQILGYGADIMTCRVWFESDAVGAVHSHPHSQTSYVESGRFLYQVGDHKTELRAGDCAYIAPHVLHGAACLEAGVLIDCFSPMRADFLAVGEAA
jgi:quercetin dioxygenase-like cupin family protein